ncbi:hypothetical protein GCM10011428_39440 [Streptomyces violaceus]
MRVTADGAVLELLLDQGRGDRREGLVADYECVPAALGVALGPGVAELLAQYLHCPRGEAPLVVGQVDAIGGQFVRAEDAEGPLLGPGAQDGRDRLRERQVRGAVGDLGGGGDAAARCLKAGRLGSRPGKCRQKMRSGPALWSQELAGLVGGQPVGQCGQLGGAGSWVAQGVL